MHAVAPTAAGPAASGGARLDAQAAGWLERTLTAAEAAADTALALRLPPPIADEQRGGDDRYDIYLVGGEPQARGWPDPPTTRLRLDRSSAFAVTAPPRSAGCGFDNGVARAFAEAALLGLDARIDDGTLGLQASYLATLAVPCTNAELESLDDAQRTPERGLTRCRPGPLCGGWPFSWYLDVTYGASEPGAVMTAAIALAAGQTDRAAPVLGAEPDPFDVLRLAASDRSTSLDDILLDFAVDRAFLGSRSDGGHLPDADRFGWFGRVRFEWAVTTSSLPRRLAPARPIEPTGMSYLWLGVAPADRGMELLFEADWESGQLFRWALVKVDAQGRELGRIRPGGAYGSHRVQQTVADLGGVDGLLVVGVAIGSDDRSHPFDPDALEPAIDYAVTLRRL